MRLGERTEMLPVASVTGNFLQVLGMRPLIGRDFRAEEEGLQAPPLAILTHALWRERFGSDPGVVGRTVTVEGKPLTVVGVLGPEFRWPGVENTPSAGYGLPQLLMTIVPPGDTATRRNASWIDVVARLRDGVSLEQARSGLEALAARLRTDFPVDQLHVGIQAIPLRDAQVGSVRPVLLVLWGAVALLLVLTCANVANLLLARAVSREHEMAVRSALGATRSDLVRKLLAESVLLGLLGALLGWVLARAALPALTAGIPPAQRATLPFLQDLRLDSVALLHSIVLAVLTGVLFGVVPAMRLSRADLATSLKEAGCGAPRPGGTARCSCWWLLQVALAVILLNGAGVFARSLSSILSVDPGFRPDGVVVGTLSLPRRKMKEPEVLAVMDRVVAAARRVAVGEHGGRDHAAAGHDRLRPDGGARRRDGGPDRPSPPLARSPTTTSRRSGCGSLAGRLFGPQDVATAPAVAVVNETFVRLHFPGRDGLGERFQLTYKPDGEVFTVVGVVRTNASGPSTRPGRGLLPALAAERLRRSAAGHRGPQLPGARRSSPRSGTRSSAVDGDLALESLQAMPAMLADSPAVFGRRYPVWLLGVFASCATLLAAIGLFGVLSYVVSERTHELGIRIALGAGPREVIRDVARRALPAVRGWAAGGRAGLGPRRGVLRGLLYEARGFDVAVLGPVVASMLLTAVLALLVPARRAVAVDPATALRAE